MNAIILGAVAPEITTATDNIGAVTSQLSGTGTALGTLAGTLIGVALLIAAVKVGMKVFRKATGA